MVYLPCHPPKSGNTFLPHHHSLILRPWERVQTEAHYALYGSRMIVEFISNEMSKTLNPAQLKSAIAFVSALMKCPHSLWLNSILNSLYLVKLQPHIFFRSHLHNSNQQIGLRKFWGNNWNNFPLHKNKYMLTYRHNRWRALVSMSLLSPLEPVVSTSYQLKSPSWSRCESHQYCMCSPSSDCRPLSQTPSVGWFHS